MIDALALLTWAIVGIPMYVVPAIVNRCLDREQEQLHPEAPAAGAGDAAPVEVLEKQN